MFFRGIFKQVKKTLDWIGLTEFCCAFAKGYIAFLKWTLGNYWMTLFIQLAVVTLWSIPAIDSGDQINFVGKVSPDDREVVIMVVAEMFLIPLALGLNGSIFFGNLFIAETMMGAGFIMKIVKIICSSLQKQNDILYTTPFFDVVRVWKPDELLNAFVKKISSLGLDVNPLYDSEFVRDGLNRCKSMADVEALVQECVDLVNRATVAATQTTFWDEVFNSFAANPGYYLIMLGIVLIPVGTFAMTQGSMSVRAEDLRMYKEELTASLAPMVDFVVQHDYLGLFVGHAGDPYSIFCRRWYRQLRVSGLLDPEGVRWCANMVTRSLALLDDSAPEKMWTAYQEIKDEGPPVL